MKWGPSVTSMYFLRRNSTGTRKTRDGFSRKCFQPNRLWERKLMFIIYLMPARKLKALREFSHLVLSMLLQNRRVAVPFQSQRGQPCPQRCPSGDKGNKWQNQAQILSVLTRKPMLLMVVTQYLGRVTFSLCHNGPVQTKTWHQWVISLPKKRGIRNAFPSHVTGSRW